MFRLGICLLFCFIATNDAGKCTKEENLIPSESDSHLVTVIVCKHVTSDLLLEFDYEAKPHRQELWIKSSTIHKLKPNSFSKFSGISDLHLSKIGLKEIEDGAFNGLLKLENLVLSGNKLTTLPKGAFDSLTTLNNLDLSNNQIGAIEDDSFSGLSNLTILDLRGNKIKSLDKNLFEDLKMLEILWVSDNPLTTLPDGEFPQLRKIVVDNTHVKEMNVNFTKSPLDFFQLTDSQLEEFDCANVPNLTTLELHNNKIKVVHHWEKLDCDRVSLHHNKITSFDISPNVIQLHLRNNHIRSIGNTPSGHDKKLELLDLARNKISEITSESFLELTQLKFLVLQHNQITVLHKDVFRDLPNLITLDLSYNKIRTVEANPFNGLKRLNTLRVSGNRIRKDDFRKYVNNTRIW